MWEESDRCSCNLAFKGRALQAYNEEAFRYFLAVERRRAERSSRSFLLLLVNLKMQRGIRVRIDPVVAARLFSGLWFSVRDADFIGWYRGESVVGAVLTQRADTPEPDVCRRIARRVKGVLFERLPSRVARCLQVRVLQLQPRLNR